eukprot:TRINITY_DN1532_c0_g1_i1.p1 TRINITY_DN1532_c0_g1~~TRINITY_DN1532_c0_g1_i1.p1  ORF type:complete len:446 (+),score=129.28 TRINITY_DN1532_c0_g1_i1:102-1439(+)
MVKTCKVVILGGEGCGKTSLVLRYVQARYTDVYDPHVVDVYKREDSVLGESVVFTIVDVCGGDGFESLRMEKCAEADAFVFVADASSADSIDAVFSVRQALVLEAALKPSILAVAKCDAGAPSEQVTKRAAAWGMAMVKFSSKENYGVDDVFREVALTAVPGLREAQRKGGTPLLATSLSALGTSPLFDPSQQPSDRSTSSGGVTKTRKEAPALWGCSNQSKALLVPVERHERQRSITPLMLDGTSKTMDPSVSSPLCPLKKSVPALGGDLLGSRRGVSGGEKPQGDLRKPLLSSPAGGTQFSDPSPHSDSHSEDLNVSQANKSTKSKSKFFLRLSQPSVKLKNMAPFSLGPASRMPPKSKEGPEGGVLEQVNNASFEAKTRPSEHHASPSVGSMDVLADRRQVYVSDLSPDRDHDRTESIKPTLGGRPPWYKRLACCGCCKSRR